MMAVAGAWARGFFRDRSGMALTLLLPPLVYLLFAAIFGAGARGDIDASVAVHDAARSSATAAVVDILAQDLGPRVRLLDDAKAVERAVVDGRADVGVLIASDQTGAPQVTVVSAAGRDVAATALQARLAPMAAALAGRPAPPSREVSIRQVGPQGDVQAAYYAGAVSVMFVFFAAMHGAMGGLDERRSGLQARLALARGGMTPILAGRTIWLTIVGLMQSAAVFIAAWPRLPDLSAWQAAAALLTAALVAFCAAGMALALTATCRSREQAQPLTTFVALLLAALGGSMAPRFLMPEAFRALGWITPHAWAVETYQALVWRGRFDAGVLAGWAALGGVGLAGLALAVFLEQRRAGR